MLKGRKGKTDGEAKEEVEGRVRKIEGKKRGGNERGRVESHGGKGKKGKS